MTEPTKAAVYRVRLGIDHSANSSGGDWRYYEDRERLERELLDAYLDARGVHDRNRDRRNVRRLIEAWRRHRQGTDETYPRVSDVFEVARFDGTAWVPLTVQFTEPAVLIHEESAAVRPTGQEQADG